LGETLLDRTATTANRNYRVTVQVTPINDAFTIEEFENTIQPIQQTLFTKAMNLGQFRKKKGVLKDNSTNKTSPFELGSSFQIQPSIVLSKYITINHDDSDFETIKSYCLTLLESIKPEIYPQHAVRER
jgi:hypothetical protein